MRRAGSMRRLALLLAALAAFTFASAASAHPLGNFSINHLAQVSIDPGAVHIHWILDQAEIPTFQERDLSTSAVLARKRAEVARALTVTVNGRRVPLTQLPGARLTHPPGQGGLLLTRVELDLVASVPTAGRVEIRDETFPNRVGWKAIVARPGRGTDVRSSVPSGDRTNGLRAYPKDTLSSPLDERSAQLDIRRGTGTLTAPPTPGSASATTGNRSGDGLAGVFSRAASGHGVFLLLLLAAFGWGALHALSPGHGKSMVAAYLVGAKGTARHAVALGATVTITHTIGVFALGFVTLLLSAYVLPEQLYPWLNLASGVLVLTVGAGVLRGRLRRRRESEGADDARAQGPDSLHNEHDRVHEHAHEHPHGHSHDHDPGRSHEPAHFRDRLHDHDVGHSHEHAHAHAHGHEHDHRHEHQHAHAHAARGHRGHAHAHVPQGDITWRSLIALGASAGLIPCPSALVVLLGAVAQHQVGLGLIMISAFSLGLAGTLVALGLLVVSARGLTSRMSFAGPVAAALPAVSALVIVGLGCAITARALGQLA